jgi:hypothetical protein
MFVGVLVENSRVSPVNLLSSYKRFKKRTTDRGDARLLLRLMRKDRFPQIWVPSPENRTRLECARVPARNKKARAALLTRRRAETTNKYAKSRVPSKV